MTVGKTSGRTMRLLAELHHSRAARIRVAGGGAGAGGTPLVGSAPNAQASAWGFPTVSPSHPSVFPHHGIQRITVEFSEESQNNGDLAGPARPLPRPARRS